MIDACPASKLAALLVAPLPAPVELAGLDWERLLPLAGAHGVAPLLYWRLQQAGMLEGLPQSANRDLAAAYFRSTANHQVLLGELERLLPALHQAGVWALPLKGALLAAALYPQPALRPMSDLDLLLRPSDLQPALAVCSRLGYRLEKITYHAVLQSPGETAALELHWTLPGGQPLSPDWWQLACGPYPAGAALLYAAAHLAVQHPGSPRLIWLYDLHLLLTQWGDQIDWPALLPLAERLGWQEALSQALRQAVEAFGSPLPPGQPAAALPALPAGSPSQTAWTREAWRALGAPVRLALFGRLLFPAGSYMRWRYRPQPEWLWPAYYPRRLVDWLRESRPQ